MYIKYQNTINYLYFDTFYVNHRLSDYFPLAHFMFRFSHFIILIEYNIYS